MYKTHIKATTLVLLTAVLFAACTKIDTTSVGSGLIPGVDNIHTFDTTFDVIAVNYDNINECDSVSFADLHALGVINNNPLFGSSLANIYLELKPSAYPVALPAHDTLSMVVDSVVLVLKYDHSYGDTLAAQKVQVYEVSQKMKLDSAYKTCNLIAHESELLGEADYIPANLNDSIHGFEENAAKQLRIKLDNSWGTDFINNVSKFKTDSAFKQYFKGFAIVADEATGGEALNYFSLTSAATRLSIYVRSKKDTVKDTAMINLTFNNSSANANYIKRDRGASEITQHLSQPVNGDSLIFIQTTPGSYALLKIQGLSSFPNSVIHRAELIAEQVYDPAAVQFQEPRMLYLQAEDPDKPGRYTPIPCDFNIGQLQSGFSYFGGFAKNSGDGNGNTVSRYAFNISRYMQSIVTRDKANTTLKLSAPFYIHNDTAYTDRCNQLITPFRPFRMNQIADGGVKLNGSTLAPKRIRLYVVYSKL